MIPYRCDEPLYHPPIATGSISVLVLLLFLFVSPDPKDRAFQEPALQGLIQPVHLPQEWTDEDFADPGEQPQPRQNLRPADDQTNKKNSRNVRLSRPNLYLHFDTFNPLQWITSPFLHTNFGELFVNLIGLWSLGFVIEGRLGAGRFLLLLGSVALGHAATIQTLLVFTGVGGSTAGLAPAVLGLYGLALLWMPKSTFEIWFGFLIGVQEVSVLIYGLLECGCILFACMLGRDIMIAGLFPLLGLAYGAGLGFLWLHKGWIDCEGRDLLSLLLGQKDTVVQEAELDSAAQDLLHDSLGGGGRPKPKANAADPLPLSQRTRRRAKEEQSPLPRGGGPLPPASHTASEANNPLGLPIGHDLIDDVALLIEQDNATTALKLLEKIRIDGNKSQLPQASLAKLVRLLLKDQAFKAAMPFMFEHVQRFEVQRESMQISLAKILLHQERPQRALDVLSQVQTANLDEKGRGNLRNLVAHAQRLIDEGVIEFSD